MYGPDLIQFNAHRVYGPKRWPYLTSNWRQHYLGRGDQRIHVFVKSAEKLAERGKGHVQTHSNFDIDTDNKNSLSQPLSLHEEGNHLLETQRTAYVLTVNFTSARTQWTNNLLKKLGFLIVNVVPDKIGTDKWSKVWSNKNTFLKALRLMVLSGHPWAYFFEDDIGTYEDVTLREIVSFEVPEGLFFYLGVCSNLQLEGPRVCGRCAHAMAFSQAGARELLLYNESSLKAKQEPYFDAVAESWCVSHNGFPAMRVETVSWLNPSWHGAFYQKQDVFESGIQAALLPGLHKFENIQNNTIGNKN